MGLRTYQVLREYPFPCLGPPPLTVQQSQSYSSPQYLLFVAEITRGSWKGEEPPRVQWAYMLWEVFNSLLPPAGVHHWPQGLASWIQSSLLWARVFWSDAHNTCHSVHSPPCWHLFLPLRPQSQSSWVRSCGLLPLPSDRGFRDGKACVCLPFFFFFFGSIINIFNFQKSLEKSFSKL